MTTRKLFTPGDLSDEERALFLELGPEEVWQRVKDLSSWDKFTTVAQITEYGREPLTPTQAIKWAQFAQALDKDAVVDGLYIKRELDETAKVQAVLRNERYTRERKAREEAKAAEEAAAAEAAGEEVSA